MPFKFLRSLLIVLVIIVGSVSLPATGQGIPSLNSYGDLPNVEDVAISPSGRHIALVTILKGNRVVLILDENRSYLNAVRIDDAKVRSIRFVGDSGLFLTRSHTANLRADLGRDMLEVSQGVLIPVEDPEMQGTIFAKYKQIENALIGSHGIRTSADGAKGYFGGITLAREKISGQFIFQHGRPDLYEVDLQSLRPKRIASPADPGQSHDWVIGPSGKVAATLTVNRSNGVWTIKAPQAGQIAKGKSSFGGTGLLGLDHTGKRLIYTTRDDESGIDIWRTVALDGSGDSRPFLKDISAERLYWNRDNGLLMGYLERDGSSEITFFDPQHQKTAEALKSAFVGLDSRIVEWTTDFKKFVVRARGNGMSGTWFYIDIESGEAEPIGYERPGIPASAVGPISTVQYTAKDGLQLDGILTLPPSKEAKNLPLVMLPHGGPESHDKETFDWWAQALSSRGYAVFQPNFRGSNHKDQSFVSAGHGEWGGKMQTDLSDGLKHLADQGIIDPDRACIMGASYGGYAALAGVTLQQGIYRCAVAVAPVSDLSRTFNTDIRESGSSRAIMRRNLIEQLGPRSNFASISPYHQAGKADAPILIIHGTDDTRVPFKQSEIMAEALKSAGKPYEFIALDGEDHFLSKAQTRKAMLNAAVAFIQKHNPPD